MNAFAIALLSSFFLLSACATQQASVYLPAHQSVELAYPDYNLVKATLKNNSAQSAVAVSVASKQDNQSVRGFGLDTKGRAEVLVEAENKLVLANTSDRPIRLSVAIQESKRQELKQATTYISFTLLNSSATSIPLIIPSVMNPNLSPFSKSGVDLKIGQEILFRAAGKRHVLLTVDASIPNGSEIDVPQLLKQRKKELGLK